MPARGWLIVRLYSVWEIMARLLYAPLSESFFHVLLVFVIMYIRQGGQKDHKV
jgi:hypothetical protein